jgi:hypothetical protein
MKSQIPRQDDCIRSEMRFARILIPPKVRRFYSLLRRQPCVFEAEGAVFAGKKKTPPNNWRVDYGGRTNDRIARVPELTVFLGLGFGALALLSPLGILIKLKISKTVTMSLDLLGQSCYYRCEHLVN